MMKTNFRFRPRKTVGFFLGLALALGGLDPLAAQETAPGAAAPSTAQNTENQQALARYTAWNTDETLAGKHKDLIAALKAGTLDPDREKFFDNYYFARWTNPGNRGQVQGYVRDLISQDLKDASGNAREYFLQKSFNTLKKMAADRQVTPTARYNAVLAIGQLAQREPSGRNDPPLPYAAALPYLVGQYEENSNPEYVRLGALLGIVRHAQTGIADNEMKNTTVPNLLIKILESGKPAAGRDKDDQELVNWYRLRAVDGLGGLKSVGSGSKTVQALCDVLENAQETTEMQVRAARALGELDYKSAGDVNPPIPYQRIASQLISLAKRICDAEIQMIDDLKAKEKVATGGIGALGNLDGEMDAPIMLGGAGAASTGTGPSFDQLSVEQKLQVTTIFQRVKSNFSDILYGIRGRIQFSGTAQAGILAMIPGDDPLASKLVQTGRAMYQLFKILDEGPLKEDKRPRGAAMEESMDSAPATGGNRSGENLGIKPLKVNLGDIQEELKIFSAALEGIIAGGG